MKSLFAAALMTAVATPALAADWAVDMAKSHLTFQGTQTGGKAFEGEFEKFDAQISFDPDDLSGSRAKVTVDLSSATTHDKQRDAMMKTGVWLDAQNQQTATFETVTFRRLSDGRYSADGNLTLKGETRGISLPFTLDIEGDTAHAQGSVVLHRGDFGLGGKEYADGKYVGLDVTVSIDITATR